MPKKGARYRKERREKVKEEKEEKRRLARERLIASIARRRSSTSIDPTDVAVKVEATPVGSMEVEEIEETEENYFHGAPPDAK